MPFDPRNTGKGSTEIAENKRFATELQALVKSTPLVERLVKGRRFVPTAVGDGNLITGQNPRSARATAALLLASLRFRHLTERSA